MTEPPVARGCSPVPPTDAVERFFQQIEETLMLIWQEGGFGCLIIESERAQTLQQVLLQDSTTFAFAFTNQEIGRWKAKFEKRLSRSRNERTTDSINHLLCNIQSRLLRTWELSGDGHLTLNCERTGRTQNRVIVSGAPSRRFLIDDTEVAQWLYHVKPQRN